LLSGAVGAHQRVSRSRQSRRSPSRKRWPRSRARRPLVSSAPCPAVSILRHRSSGWRARTTKAWPTRRSRSTGKERKAKKLGLKPGKVQKASGKRPGRPKRACRDSSRNDRDHCSGDVGHGARVAPGQLQRSSRPNSIKRPATPIRDTRTIVFALRRRLIDSRRRELNPRPRDRRMTCTRARELRLTSRPARRLLFPQAAGENSTPEQTGRSAAQHREPPNGRLPSPVRPPVRSAGWRRS
jgi:hypothetical protein